MQLQTSFRHMSASDNLRDYAEKKILSKLQKFATKNIDAHMAFTVQGNEANVHLTIRGGDGFNLECDASTPDMYASVDKAVDKLDQQLRRHKEKLKHHKGSSSPRDLETPESAEDSDEDAIDASELLK